jgi:tetratricopeptide (TPR) repeat protein
MPVHLHAQTVQQLSKAGFESLRDKEYYKAAAYLKQAASKAGDNAELWYSYGEASKEFNDYENAAMAFQKCIQNDKDKKYPLAKFWLGIMYRHQGKTAEALKALKEFSYRYKPKDYYNQKAKQEIAACDWVKDHGTINDSITIEQEGGNVNSPYSDFNPIPLGGDSLQFSSLREVPEIKNSFKARIYNNSNNIPVINGNDEEQGQNIANGSYSISTSSGTDFYFTTSARIDERSSIYFSHFADTKNQWLPAQALPAEINYPGFSCTHPQVIEAKGKQYLLFASNMPGSKGKTDLWISKKSGYNSWEKPINLGEKINSIDQEVTPWFDTQTNTLYFASNWHYGYGGFDIFKVQVNTVEPWSAEAPVNMGMPVNSETNDLYFIENAAKTKSYFSSNRKGSKYIESKNCCNDIYSYRTGADAEKKDTPGTQLPPVIDTAPVVVSEVTTPPTDTTPAITHTPPVTSTTMVDTSTKTVAVVPVPPVTTFTEETVKPTKIITETRTSTGIKTLLPIELYFHNDEPECCNTKDSTSIDYKTSYELYINLKEVYTQEYAKVKKATAASAINAWFNDTVEYQFSKLVQFCSLALDELQAGKKLSITVAGYCSPLNDNNYNIHLGNRRVASFVNYLNLYRNGALQSFIANGSLQVVKQSAGEEKASEQVSDNRLDTPNSVYSPAASRERKITITCVETGQ